MHEAHRITDLGETLQHGRFLEGRFTLGALLRCCAWGHGGCQLSHEEEEASIENEMGPYNNWTCLNLNGSKQTFQDQEYRAHTRSKPFSKAGMTKPMDPNGFQWMLIRVQQ